MAHLSCSGSLAAHDTSSGLNSLEAVSNVHSFSHGMMFQGAPPPALVISHPPMDTWVAATSWRRWKCSREHGWVEIPPFFPDFYQFDVFRSGISVSYNNPILNFCLISTEFSIPTNRAQGFQSLHILLSVLFCCPSATSQWHGLLNKPLLPTPNLSKEPVSL